MNNAPPPMKIKFTILSFFAIILMLASCKQHEIIRYSRATVFKKKPIKERIAEYDIYVHDDAGKTYRVSEPEIVDDNLIGTPLEIADSVITGDSLNDMHLYLNESETIDLSGGAKQAFTNQNVRYVNMRGKSKNASAGIAIGLLIALLLIPIGLVVALFVAIFNSGSGSGGSGSGCYVATMSYGSYDAPQVLILREFRDRFLQKFGAGRAFIAWYYRNSPSFVAKHRNKKWLHSTLRLPLNGLVFVLKPFYSGKNAKK